MTKFMNGYIPTLLYKDRFADAIFSSVISTPLRMPFRDIIFLPVGASFLRTDSFKSMISFSIASILWSMSMLLLAVACFIALFSFLKSAFIKIYHIKIFLSKIMDEALINFIMRADIEEMDNVVMQLKHDP